jgi:CopA family copper-resistance protein
VIEPRRGERHRADREHVVLLSEWTDLDPEHIYRTLKRQSNYFNYGQRTVGDFFNDVRKQGLKPTIADRRVWGQMRMDPTDLADVSGCAYTYLMNGTTPARNWTGLFRRGERVRLRFINGSSMSFFDVRIPGLKLTVVAADGQDVEPVTVDEFRIGLAEVCDVIVEPKDDRAYTIFAQSLDRSGYARGTLAPQLGMQAEVPPLDPRPLLTMMDMGMGHDMAGMGMGHDQGNMKGAQQNGSSSNSDSMPGMDHHMSNMPGMDHGAMDHGGMAMSDSMSAAPDHAPADFGPNVDSVAVQPQSRLDDPGLGLRNNGRRVLTYADLHTLGGPIDHRQAGRDIELHLTGHMERFVWSFNGQKFSESEPLRFNYGERLRLVLVNDSMMNHPIHLHGMWGEVETEKGEFLVRKHTITVQPGQRLAYGVTADALGRWAYHCHLLYHMEAGMFREVHVERSSKDGAKS